jgi:hypothetical protein
MEATHPILPLVLQRHASLPNNLASHSLGIIRGELEAGRVNDAVELVLLAVRHDALLGDAVDALAVGVDQVDGGQVEGGQEFVVEAGALAELVVVCL